MGLGTVQREGVKSHPVVLLGTFTWSYLNQRSNCSRLATHKVSAFTPILSLQPVEVTFGGHIWWCAGLIPGMPGGLYILPGNKPSWPEARRTPCPLNSFSSLVLSWLSWRWKDKGRLVRITARRARKKNYFPRPRRALQTISVSSLP